MESAEYLYQAAPLTIPSEGRCWFQTFPCWAPGCQAGCGREAGGEMSINQLENGLWSHNMMAFPQVPSIQDAVMLSDLHSCLTLNLCKYLCTVSLPAIKSSISLTVLGTWLSSSAPYSVTMNSSSILIGQLYGLSIYYVSIFIDLYSIECIMFYSVQVYKNAYVIYGQPNSTANVEISCIKAVIQSID